MRLSGFTLSFFAMALMLALSVENTKAFVKGTATTRARPFSTELYADAKKKTAKKSDVETLRKPELLAQVADKMETSKAGADAAVTAVLDTIVENVVAGKKVSLPGFGTFQLRARAARKGRNPQTGEAIDIKASNSPGFSAAKAFKEKANE